MSNTANLCPCGNPVSYSTCCEPIIKKSKKPETAEALLRARYTSFVKGEIDFIIKSHHTKTVGDINKEEVEDWSKNSEWLGLKILQKEAGEAQDSTGKIVFHAQFKENKPEAKVSDHYELAQFEKEAGEWKFLDAQGLKSGPFVREAPKTGRNDPCTCGSGKKFKKCCGLAA